MKNRALKVGVLFVVIMVVGTPAIGEFLQSPTANTPQGSPSLIKDLNPKPVSASEDENIDNMLVNPKNRWSVGNVGFTETMTQGSLKASDTGDGSIDYYKISRSLRDVEGQIKFRFKLTIDNDASIGDQFAFVIGAFPSSLFKINFFPEIDGGYGWVSVGYDGYSAYQSERINDSIVDGLWYIMKIKYHLLESEYEWILYHDNGSRIWKRDWKEIANDEPKAFAVDTGIWVQFATYSYTNSLTIASYLSYVKAPFKEREWTQDDSPSDGDWLEDYFDLAHVQDDLTDNSSWIITVPYMDAISGYLNINATNGGNLDVTDIGYMGICLWAVDANDGDLHMVHYVLISLERDATGVRSGIIIFEDGSIIYTDSYYGASNDPRAHFSLVLHEERSISSFKVRFWPDQDGTEYNDYLAEVAISDCASDPSQEFVIMIVYQFDITGDTEWNCVLEDFSFTKQWILTGIVWAIFGTPFAGLLFLADLFIALLLWLGGIFAVVATPIVEKIVDLVPWLGDIIIAVQNIAGAIWEDFTDVLTSINGFLDDMWGVFENLVTNLVTGIWSWFVDNIGTWLEPIIDYLLNLLGDLAILVIGVIFWIWNFGGAPGDGLPNILSWLELLLDYSIAFVQWAYDTANDLLTLMWDMSWMIPVIWWAWAVLVQFGRASHDPLEGFANFMGAYFAEILPFDFLGFHIYIPQGLVFTLWLILLLPDNFFFWQVIA